MDTHVHTCVSQCAPMYMDPSGLVRAITLLRAMNVTFDECRRALLGLDGRQKLGGGRPMEEISLHILDIAQNAVEAGARSIEIEIVEDPEADLLVVEVRDDGRGMDPETLRHVTDPFFTTRTTRKVGLGLSLLQAAAEAAGGGLEVLSEVGKGTRVRATFAYSHVDRAPLGDIETTLMVLVAGNPGVEFSFRHVRGRREFEFFSRDLKAALDGIPLSSPEGLALLREVIRRGEAEVTGTGLLEA